MDRPQEQAQAQKSIGQRMSAEALPKNRGLVGAHRLELRELLVDGGLFHHRRRHRHVPFPLHRHVRTLTLGRSTRLCSVSLIGRQRLRLIRRRMRSSVLGRIVLRRRRNYHVHGFLRHLRLIGHV